jgi:hypothetical protein
MNHTQRECAINPAFASCETRVPNSENIYHRILHSGAASNQFQVLRRAWVRGKSQFAPFGSYPTLADAIAARDALPIDIQTSELKPAIPPQQPTRRVQWWEE